MVLRQDCTVLLIYALCNNVTNMNDMEKQKVNNGITFWSILGLVFIVLKLCEVIEWSWWWVLAPFWFPVVVALCIGVIALMLLAIGYAIHRRKYRM